MEGADADILSRGLSRKGTFEGTAANQTKPYATAATRSAQTTPE